MKSIKQVLREKRTRVRGWSEKHIRPAMGRIGMKLRLPSRIRLANRWARNNPKRFTACSISVLSISFLTCLVSSLVSLGRSQTSQSGNASLAGMAHAQSSINRLNELQHNADYNRKVEQEIAIQGGVIKRELDSLMAIPEKTLEDSLRIRKCYTQMKFIAKHLKTYNDEKD